MSMRRRPLPEVLQELEGLSGVTSEAGEAPLMRTRRLYEGLVGEWPGGAIVERVDDVVAALGGGVATTLEDEVPANPQALRTFPEPLKPAVWKPGGNKRLRSSKGVAKKPQKQASLHELGLLHKLHTKKGTITITNIDVPEKNKLQQKLYLCGVRGCGVTCGSGAGRVQHERSHAPTARRSDDPSNTLTSTLKRRRLQQRRRVDVDALLRTLKAGFSDLLAKVIHVCALQCPPPRSSIFVAISQANTTTNCVQPMTQTRALPHLSLYPTHTERARP